MQPRLSVGFELILCSRFEGAVLLKGKDSAMPNAVLLKGTASAVPKELHSQCGFSR